MGASTPAGVVQCHVVVALVRLVLPWTMTVSDSTSALLVDMASSRLALEDTLPSEALADISAKAAMATFRLVAVVVEHTLHVEDTEDTTRVEIAMTAQVFWR